MNMLPQQLAKIKFVEVEVQATKITKPKTEI